MTDLYLLVAKTLLSIKRIRVLLLKLHRQFQLAILLLLFFNFRLILLRTDSYCPIIKVTVKEKGKFVVAFLRPPSNVKLGNFTR